MHGLEEYLSSEFLKCQLCLRLHHIGHHYCLATKSMGLFAIPLLLVLAAKTVAAAGNSTQSIPGSVSQYVVPTAFPTSVYSSYYGEIGASVHSHERPH